MNFISELLTTKNSNSVTGDKKLTQSVDIPETTTGGGKTKKVIKYGSRRQVFNGNAERTSGGLRKEHLMKNQYGRIVSAKRHKTMKNRFGTKTD